jgi:hypothetical protein
MGELGHYGDEGKECTTGKSDFDCQQGQTLSSSPQCLDQPWGSTVSYSRDKSLEQLKNVSFCRITLLHAIA